MDNATILLTAYDINNNDLAKPYSDLHDLLRKELAKNNIANDRRMRLNVDSPEEDLLSDYSTSKNEYVYGAIWRIAPSKDIPNIPDGLFQKSTIKIDDIQDKEEHNSLVCKDHYYFVINNNFLVTSLPQYRIKSLQVYLNWLLKTDDDKQYTFTKKIKAPEETKLSEIKNITFSEAKNFQQDKEENRNAIHKVSYNILKTLIRGDLDLQELVNTKILSAKLVMQFSKPRKMDNVDYEKLLGSYMNPINDAEGILFKLKNGKTIKGNEIVRTKQVCVEKIDESRISEIALMQEMGGFLAELNKEL